MKDPNLVYAPCEVLANTCYVFDSEFEIGKCLYLNVLCLKDKKYTYNTRNTAEVKCHEDAI